MLVAGTTLFAEQGGEDRLPPQLLHLPLQTQCVKQHLDAADHEVTGALPSY